MFPLVPGMFPVMFPVQTQYLCGCSRCSHFFRKRVRIRARASLTINNSFSIRVHVLFPFFWEHGNTTRLIEWQICYFCLACCRVSFLNESDTITPIRNRGPEPDTFLCPA